jgi:hypothetical protein
VVLVATEPTRGARGDFLNKLNPPSCDFIGFPIGVILRDLLGDFLGPLLAISIL